MTPAQILVIAKAPVPGRVKTRLCPPCTPAQAALVAAAALADTIAAVDRTSATRRTLVLSGRLPRPHGWSVMAQRGDGLDQRLSNAFLDTARSGLATVLIGMDTPQVDARLLGAVRQGLGRADAVLAPAEDGGWWALALRDPRRATALRGVPMSVPETGRLTATALRAAGLTVASAPALRDVDTADDAWAVAHAHPHGAFAAAVHRHVPVGVR